AYPPERAAGDANRDGVRRAAQDEVIEIVSASDQDFDLGSYQLLTRASNGADTLRHTFAANTILPPGTCIVVFGGAQVSTFNPNDPAFGGAQVVTASTGGLSLLNGGSTITLDAAEVTIETGAQQQFNAHAFDQAGRELTGVIFRWQTSDAGVASIDARGLAHGLTVGTCEITAQARGVSSAPASLMVREPVPVLTRIEITPNELTLPISVQQQFTARAFDQRGHEMSGVVF